MKRIRLNGVLYALPFVDVLRQLTPDEFAALRADIQATKSVQHAITVAVTPNWGRVIVDGGHRAAIAEEFDLDVMLVSLGELSAEEARDRCLALNLNRRHLTPEEMQEARAKRITRVVEARQQGKSLRAIADQEKVSVTCVRRDLETRPADVPLPTFVTATNGAVFRAVQIGTRKSKQPKTAPERAQLAVLQLTAAFRAMLKSRFRDRLETIAAAAGAPLDGNDWPYLEALRSIIRDVASGGVQGETAPGSSTSKPVLADVMA